MTFIFGIELMPDEVWHCTGKVHVYLGLHTIWPLKNLYYSREEIQSQIIVVLLHRDQ